jgi:hypothetical protein
VESKAFTETWVDFVVAWPKIKYPIGQGVIEAAFQRAVASEPPRKAAELYSEKHILLLASLCRELQHAAGDRPFFLDCRTAGRKIGVHPGTAWRLLAVLFVADGILSAGEKGSKAAKKANEYRYIAD